MYLVFDTETNGLTKDAAIVQFAAILYSADQKIIGEFKTLVKPDGWTIPEDATKIHGITTEDCEKYGLSILSVLGLFGKWCEIADILIAHNISFDLSRIIYHRDKHDLKTKVLLPTRSFCTMQTTTNICKLPGKYDSYKWPKLQEAYKHFFGENFDGAHDALADVKACARVYFHLLQNPHKEDAEAA